MGGKATTDGGDSECSRGICKDTRRGFANTQVLDVPKSPFLKQAIPLNYIQVPVIIVAATVIIGLDPIIPKKKRLPCRSTAMTQS